MTGLSDTSLGFTPLFKVSRYIADRHNGKRITAGTVFDLKPLADVRRASKKIFFYQASHQLFNSFTKDFSGIFVHEIER